MTVSRTLCARDLRRGRWPLFGLTLLTLAGGAAAAGPVLPTGGQVQAGSATIAANSGSKLTIDQSSSRAIINWTSFSIGAGDAVQFNNGSGATLNRVMGSAGSAIDGLLSGTGSVYLINQNGVIIGRSGVVNVGGTFAASTLDLTNNNFLAGGNLTFTSASTAAVINYGKIGALGGDVALIAAKVDNEGEIDAPNGDVGLAAGYQVVLRDASLDDGKFAVVVGGPATSATNGGVIEAADAELRANDGNVYALAGNTQSVIKATGVAAGGGRVFLVAEGGDLHVAGDIQARGANGAGGQIETSGASVTIGAATIDAGKGGAWLLDPDDLTIDQTAANTIAASLDGGTSVTQQTTASGVGGSGDILVDSGVSIDWTTNAGLTLSAYRNIGIGAGASIASTGGGAVTLHSDNSGTGVGTVSFDAGSSVSTSGAVSIFYNPSVNPAGSGVNASSYVNPTENFAGDITGGGTLTAFMLVNTLADLQDMQNNLGGTYALGADIDASATSDWNGGAGFVPVGGNAEAAFTGMLNGDGHTISNLFIDYSIVTPGMTTGDNYTTNGAVGLFGVIGVGGDVQGITLAGANVTAADSMSVGALAGLDFGAISNASSSGAVTGGASAAAYSTVAAVGGLAGEVGLGGTVSNSSSSANVSGGGGGLVGSLNSGGSITDSYASGQVTASGGQNGDYTFAGGLVGVADGNAKGGAAQAPVSISNSYATGNVITGGTSDIGGLAGYLVNGQITDAYATGTVTQTAGGSGGLGEYVGGFVGSVGAGGSVTQSYSSGAVSTQGGPDSSDYTDSGGFAGGMTTGASVINSYSLSPVTSTSGFNLMGGFVGYENGAVSTVYATGLVTGPGADGGLVGFLDAGGVMNNSYWDEGTTGLTNGYCCGTGSFSNNTGVGGSSGASAYAAATYSTFDLSDTGPWVIFDGSTRPMLRMEASTTITNAHQLQLMALDPSANYTLAGDIDLSTTANNTDVWNPATGFVPVGGNANATFTGTLEGNGWTLTSLFINDSPNAQQTSLSGYPTAGDVGLFGEIGAGGQVRDLQITQANVTGGDATIVGILAGANSGSINNVYTSGSVATGAGEGLLIDLPLAGGLAGQTGLGGSVVNSSSSATVSGGNDSIVGGLLGGLASGGSVDNSYATGDVTVGDNVNGVPIAGGLIGSVAGYTGEEETGPDPASVTNSRAFGNVTGGAGSLLGGFVGGVENATVSNSYATGSVTQTGSPQDKEDNVAGGFVGYVDNGGSITQSYATGAVVQTSPGTGGLEDLIGGFAGNVGAGGSISQVYSSGAVTTVGGADNLSYTDAGGLVGAVSQTLSNPSSVTDSYSLSTVISTGVFNLIGGVAGYSDGAIARTYAVGLVSGAGAGGGLVRYLDAGGTLTDSYWDEGTTGLTNGYCCGTGSATNIEGVGGSTGISPYAAASYVGFDLSSTGPWVIFDGSTRPMLRMEYSTTITNAHQLQLMALDPTANYTLATDIDLVATSSDTDVWNPATGFVPVGGNNQADFTGTFNGDGHTLSNLYIDYSTVTLETGGNGYPSDGAVGLFGTISQSGVVQDVTLANANVTGVGAMTVGALAGEDFGAVANAASSGTVATGASAPNYTPVSSAGGLIGEVALGGSLSNSTSSADVTAGAGGSAGGLVGGVSSGGSLAQVSASGAVTGGGDNAGSPAFVGGLVGVLDGEQDENTVLDGASIVGGSASGDVVGQGGSLVGGLVGYVLDAQVSNSYATGSVTQTSNSADYANYAGGFAGIVGPNSSITTSYASGAVSTFGGASSANYTDAGGFVGGLLAGSSITNSYSLSPVSSAPGYNLVGGFAGYNDGSISQVYAAGDTTTSAGWPVGGLVGYLDASGTLTDSYWDEGSTGLTNGYCCGTGSATNIEGVGGSTGISPYAAASYVGFDLSSTGPWVIFDGSTRPMLRMEYSTTITNAHQLQLMALDPTANYTLATDIDLAATSSDTDVWNPATGFVPVGGNNQADFTGTFNGDGHTLSNLFINDAQTFAQTGPSGYPTGEAVGLFGEVGVGGEVRDLQVTQADVTGGDGSAVGIIAGISTGAIAGVYTSGAVTTGSGAGLLTDNALVGGVAGGVGLGGSIVNSASSATIIAGNDAVDAGGLVGTLASGGSISASYATGSVTVGEFVTDTPFAGGLVGAIYGFDQETYTDADPVTISSSYATGLVQGGGGSFVGGFAGSIENATVTGSYATGAVLQTSGSGLQYSMAGGFAGWIDQGSQVSQSYATGSVTQMGPGSNGFSDLIGGFVGDLAGASIDQVYSSGAVSTVGGVDGETYTPAGGLAGYVSGEASIADAYSLSSVSSGGTLSLVGGLIGQLNGGTVTRTYAAGSVTSPNALGGLVGYFSGGSLTNSYWDEGTTGLSFAYCCTTAPGTFTASDLTGVGGGSGISAYAAASYANLDLSATGPWVIFDGSTRPMLRMEYSTTITNAHQLQLTALDPTADYTLANDINLSATSNGLDVWNPATGFVPVGGNAQANFTGTFEGNGFTLSNLFINDSTISPQADGSGYATDGSVGLFGAIGQGGVVRDVELQNVSVTGVGAMTVGALAGTDYGTITNTGSSGSVTAGSTAAGYSLVAVAGGLVGQVGEGGTLTFSSSSVTVTAGTAATAGGLVGDLNSGGSLANVSASGSVVDGGDNSGSYGFAGGLVGAVYGYSAQGSLNPDVVTITNASATGSVTSGGGSIMGGFVGLAQNGQISSSYAGGAVSQTSASSTAFGLAGGFAGDIDEGSQVINSYATGAVTQTASGSMSIYAGGFAGYVGPQGAVANSYSTGAVSAPGSSGSQSNFTFAGGLVANDAGSVTGSNSTSSVTSVAGGGIVAFVGGSVGYLSGSLSNDTSSGAVSAPIFAGGLVGNDGAGSISNSSSSSAVSGSTYIGGLVGQWNGGTISNSSASGTVIGTGSDVGGLVGQVTNGGIQASSATGAVSGSANVGALVGDNSGSITGSQASGNVTATNGYGGGLVGAAETSSIIVGSTAAGSVTDTNFGFDGGLVGHNSGSISGSSASGNVLSPGTAGGLVGQAEATSTITNSSASGVVTAGNDAGGLVGVDFGAITNSFSTGAVVGTGGGNFNDGGLVGLFQSSGSITSSSASGTVTGESSVGGLVGADFGDVEASTASGNVSGVFQVGGLVGEISGGAIGGSSASGVVTGQSSVGGLVGLANGGGATITNSSASGAVSGGDSIGGLIGDDEGNLVSEDSASGTVTLVGAGSHHYGGLIGFAASADISDSYATGNVTAQDGANGVGGLIGDAVNGTSVSQSYATGQVTGDAITGGLVGSLQVGSTIDSSHATGAVIGLDGQTGGLVGSNSGVITNTYATGDVSDPTSGVGGLVGVSFHPTGYTIGPAGEIASSYATGNVSGGSAVGGLAGQLDGDSITDSSASGQVTGGAATGGLVGDAGAGLLSNDHATGVVSGAQSVGGLVGDGASSITSSYATGAVSGLDLVGGLVGQTDGTISSSYATGDVTGSDTGGPGGNGGLVGYLNPGGTITTSFASGAVTGYNSTGGLVGDNFGVISDAYATGTAAESGFGASNVGGLVGDNYGGQIYNSYSTGFVFWLSGSGGGLVGQSQIYPSVNPPNVPVIQNSYWDTQTSGWSTSSTYQNGAPTSTTTGGLTTAQLQSGLPTGFDPSVWSAVAGETYPYLNWQFGGGTPQVVTGFAFQQDGATPYVGGTAQVYFGGASLQSALTGGNAATGANGYYYELLAPGTLPASAGNDVGVLLFAPGGSTAISATIGLGYNGGGGLADGSMTGLNVSDQDPFLRTSATSYSALTGDLSSTFGAMVYTEATAAIGQTGDLTQVQATGNFTIDEAVSSGGQIQIESGGDLSIAANGSVTSSAGGDAIILAANGNFINNAGSAAVTVTGGGRWLIYSQANGSNGASPTGDEFGGLTAKSYYGDAFTFGAAATDDFASSPNAGDRFVYGYQPTLTVTVATETSTYNGEDQTDAASVLGLQNGDSQADAVQGILTTNGKDVGTYALGAGLTSDENYDLVVTPGSLTITPLALTASLTGVVEKTYDGGTAAALSSGNYALPGVLAGDNVTLSDPTVGVYDNANAGAGKTVSVTGVALVGNNLGDYTLPSTTASGAVGVIDPRAVTITGLAAANKIYDATTIDPLTGTASDHGVLSQDASNVALSGTAAGAFADPNAGTAKTVTVSGLSLTGSEAGNYVLTPLILSANITPKTVTASFNGSVEKTYDGTTTAFLTAGDTMLQGEIASDVTAGDVNLTGSAIYSTKNAGSNILVSVTGAALSGVNAADYQLSSTSFSAKVGIIDPKMLTASLVGVVDQTYNGSTTASLAAGNYSLTGGIIAGDTVNLNDPANGTYASKDAGAHILVTATGVKLTGASAGNYAIASSTLSANIGEIDPKVLTAALTGSVSRAYDATTVATLAASNYKLTGVVAGDPVVLSDPTTGTFDTKDVGTAKTITVSSLTLNNNAAGDYVLASNTISGAIGKITALTVTDALTGTVEKTYDGTATASLTSANYSMSGILLADAGSVTLNNPITGAYSNANAGTGKTITVTGVALTNDAAGDYVLASSKLIGAIGTIDPKVLTASLVGVVDQTYNGTTTATLAAGNYALTGGIIAGDTVSLNDPTKGTYAGDNVGSGISVTVTGVKLTGASAGNYTIGTTTLTGSIGEIDPKVLTASLTGSVTQVYNATTVANLAASNYKLTGIIAGDTVVLNDPLTGVFDTKDVGTAKNITVSGLMISGASAMDYSLATTTIVGAIGKITPYTLTAALVGSVTKPFDGTTTANLTPANYQLTGVFAADSGQVGLNDPATGTYASKGSNKTTTTNIKVTATGVALTGAAAKDYVLPSSTVSGTIGTITP